MKIGVSTGSFFLRELNEDALDILNDIGVENIEMFLASYCEYKPEYIKILNERKKNLNIFSIHANGTQFEPQLFSGHPRQKEDAYLVLDDFLRSAKELGAKYYTFHGPTRVKKSFAGVNYENCSRNTNLIIERAEQYGVGLSYETVEWCYFNTPEFFINMRQMCPKLNCVLDIKQIKIVGGDVSEFIEAMQGRISHIHVTGFNELGTTCLPGRGKYDFEGLFKMLNDAGFNGYAMIEVYKNDYKEYKDLKQSVDFLQEILYKNGFDK